MDTFRGGADAVSSRSERGRVVALLGLSGGVGTSSRSVQLAKRHGIVVDLDFATAGLTRELRESPVSTMADLTVPTSTAMLDPRHLGAVTYPHGPTHIVAAPVQPEIAELVSVPVLLAVVEAAASTAKAVVLDLGARFDPRTLAACARADEIQLVCGASARHAVDKRVLMLMSLLSRANVFAPIRVVGGGGLRSQMAARTLNRRHGLSPDATAGSSSASHVGLAGVQ